MSQLIGKQVVLTLKCSTICTVPKHRAFVQTLGLKKVGDTRQCEYTPNVHGIVKRIPYLVEVTVKE
ncbi:MAG: 50S ribosomal protein L30 [Acidobacteria bacterium ADurb.Bin340]|jgi:large subunit ribosomal protein L30|nr:MAG: 50S ribosomal protein L30 [Acidobacteria bacterium ADurb.Bin340]